MSALASLLALLSHGIDHVATGLVRLVSGLRRRRRIELIEQANGAFLMAMGRNGAFDPLDQPTLRFDQNRVGSPPQPLSAKMLAGSRVHLILAPTRFICRPLELPRAAGQFLDGVVRAQIDRLSPWNASAALFGWSAPVEVGSDRIALTVAATARAPAEQIARALIASGSASVEISTRVGEREELVVLERQAGDETGVRRVRRVLVAGLAVSGLAFATSLVAWIAIGAGYDARLAVLQNQVAERRVKLLGQRDSNLEQTLKALQSRKRTNPSAVLAIEALSNTLPDDAHLTDLRIDGGKVQIVGFANDAAALIPLIEQSGRFARATFFAPTIRGPNGGENFHIEAQIGPPLPPAPSEPGPARSP